LNNVSFGYENKNPLFKGINLQILGGKTTAIVGATGSGKTTILSLLSRLYEVDEGSITIGDIDIRDINIAKLRSSYAVVAQDIVVFNDTVWENVRYARPEASFDEIQAAIEAAELTDTVKMHGDESVGPKGTRLSGGQKQRIAIARAILRLAPIVFFDEATSALDQRTEDKIQKTLSAMSTSKTKVIISHRLSAVVNADIIYVMDDGAIVEQGTHESLIKNNGLYKAMFESQRSSYR
jgi:ATP-binding cassette subfamily B protein/subfamily B ATP-binding cassette protein MsbA